MKRILFLSILITAISVHLSAQVFCISDKQFTWPEIALRAGLSPSFLVRFDIDGFSPHNFQISPLDSASRDLVEMFEQYLVNNLGHLIYLRDSSSFQLKVKYLVRPTGSLTTSYAELITNDEIHVVAQQPYIHAILCSGVTQADPKIDTVIIESTIKYRSGKARSSDIFVQRLFPDKGDTTIILRNNYPELEQDIYTSARKYSKEHFLDRGSNARFYFIHFRVERDISPCGAKQIF